MVRATDINIKVVKVKEYNAPHKNIICIDGKPICIVRGTNTLNNCISYLLNGEPDIKDGKIKKILDSVRGGKNAI